MNEKKTPSIRMMYKDVSIDERTRDYVEKRVRKLEKYIDKILEFEVEICMDKKGKFRAEIMAKTPYNLYRSEEISESVEGSVDIVVDELQKQITKDKDRVKELRERGARSLKKKTVIAEEARF